MTQFPFVFQVGSVPLFFLLFDSWESLNLMEILFGQSDCLKCNEQKRQWIGLCAFFLEVALLLGLTAEAAAITTLAQEVKHNIFLLTDRGTASFFAAQKSATLRPRLRSCAQQQLPPKFRTAF